MFRTLLLTAFVGFSCAAEAQGAWKLMHDPTALTVYPPPTVAETTLIRRASKIAGFKQVDGPATSTMLLLSRVPGPFLKKGAQETALLYGNGREEIALIVLRGGKPALHLLLSRETEVSFLEAYALKDIDGDGLREVVVKQEYADGGGRQDWLAYLNFAGVDPGGVPAVSPAFRTGVFSCPSGEGERIYRLWVRPAQVPQFRADELGSGECASRSLKVLRTGIKPRIEGSVPGLVNPRKLPLP